MSTTEQLWRRAVLREHVTIGDVIRNLDQVAIKIVLITDQIGTLQGTISDGDVRRGLLKGLDLSSPITDIIHRDALVAPEGTNTAPRNLPLICNTNSNSSCSKALGSTTGHAVSSKSPPVLWNPSCSHKACAI